MKEDEIVKCLVKLFENVENAKAIPALDFTEEREDNMIVVGLDSTETMNVNLPDYKYHVSIIIDTHIEGDEDASQFNKTYNDVIDILNVYSFNEQPCSEVFGDIPIVGLFMEDMKFDVVDTSNRATISLTLIGSF